MDESSLRRHSVSVSLAQLSATIFRKEGLQGWPQFMNLLQHSTHSSHSPEKEVLALPCRWEGGTKAGQTARPFSYPLLLDRWDFCC